MSRLLLLTLLITSFSCTQKSFTPIEFDSRGYEFNQEIAHTFEQTGDLGFSATSYSFVSEYQKIIQVQELSDTIKQALPDSSWFKINREFEQVDAKTFILEKAKEHEIIMFNENHYLAKHRNFIRSLLPALYDQGYRFLAVEGIGMIGDGTMYDKGLKERLYPSRLTGYYINEPEYNMLLREALALRFNLIGYDEGGSFGFSGGEREERGANNIIEQMKALGDNGKLIVLCGWDHLKEGNSGTYWEYALAERLKKKTKQDPLTINQTAYNERINKAFEKPLMQRIETNRSIILVNKNGEALDLTKDKNWYDVFVIHPRTTFVNCIPDWIIEEGPIKKFNLSKLEMKVPFKVFVFDSKDDPKIAAPIYVLEVENKNKKISIPSRGKKIKLVATNKKESFLIE